MPSPAPINPDVMLLALDSVLQALVADPRLSQAQREARARGTVGIVDSIQPENGLELMLAGQAILFNEMVADAARDTQVLEVGEPKMKARAAAVNLAKVFGKNVDQLIRLKGRPARPTATVPEDIKPIFAAPAETGPGRTRAREAKEPHPSRMEPAQNDTPRPEPTPRPTQQRPEPPPHAHPQRPEPPPHAHPPRVEPAPHAPQTQTRPERGAPASSSPVQERPETVVPAGT